MTTRAWNNWWTLTLLNAGVAIGAGWFTGGPIGLALSALAFAIVTSAAAALWTMQSEVDQRLTAIHDTLNQILVILDQRLPDRPRL